MGGGSCQRRSINCVGVNCQQGKVPVFKRGRAQAHCYPLARWHLLRGMFCCFHIPTPALRPRGFFFLGQSSPLVESCPFKSFRFGSTVVDGAMKKERWGTSLLLSHRGGGHWRMAFSWLSLQVCQNELVRRNGNGIGQEQVEDYGKQRPPPTGRFLLDYNDSNKAWGVKQGKEQEGRGVGSGP